MRGVLAGNAGFDRHRDRRILGGAVAQLSIIIPAPGPEGAVGLDGQHSSLVSADSGSLVHNLNRHRGILGGSAAKLAVVVPAPGPEGTVGLDGRGLILIPAHGGYAVHNLHRDVGILGGAAAQLSVTVPAPSPEGAVGFQNGCAAPAQVHSRRAVHDLHRLSGIRVGSVAQLSVIVAAPHPQGTISLDGGGVVGSQADAGYILQDLDGCGLIVFYRVKFFNFIELVSLTAVAQLAVDIFAPHPEGTIGLDRRHRMGVLVEGHIGHAVHDLHRLCLVYISIAVRFLRFSVVADMAVLIVAPHPQGAVGFNRRRIKAACPDRGHIVHHLHRRDMDVVLGGVVEVIAAANIDISAALGSQLAVVVAAPHPKGFVGLDGGADAVGNADGGHAVHHLHRYAGIISGSAAQLAADAAAPGPKGTAVIQIRGVGQTHGDGGGGGGFDVVCPRRRRQAQKKNQSKQEGG